MAELSSLLDELKSRLKAINADQMSSVQRPSYPLLESIRAQLCDDQQLVMSLHQKLIDDIITECIFACEVVAPIVCSDSPEGHLPSDVSNQLMEQQEKQVKTLYVTSRMLLLNGWKTVKESVTIISHLVDACSAPAHRDDVQEDEVIGLVNCSTARTVIDFLYEYQLRLVHRGAFEQCARAFSRLVSDLWRNGCPRCCAAIQDILQQVQGNLTSSSTKNSGEKYLLTRRSAGLPFILTSILAAEQWAPGGGTKKSKKKGPRNSSPKGGALVVSLVELLQPSRLPEGWQVVHSLNILKALVTDSRLPEVIAPFIESIFRLCIDCGWFDRRTYPNSLATDNEGVSFSLAYSIQNCTSRLFSALMTRVFGVKRNRADTSLKNRMSPRLFFSTYPSLYPIMLQQLENAISTTENSVQISSVSSSLYPTLIILSRLTQTTSSSAESNSSVQQFAVGSFLPPLLRLCTSLSACLDVRLCALTVRVYVQLLPLSEYAECFQFIDEQLFCSGTKSANALYGFALLGAQLVMQYTLVHLESKEADSDGHQQHIRTVLLSIYKRTMKRVMVVDRQTMKHTPGQTLHQLHLLHSRIYSLATLAGWTEFAGENHVCLLFSSIFKLAGIRSATDDVECLDFDLRIHEDDNALSPATAVHHLAEDQFMVGLLVDALVHALPTTNRSVENGSSFSERLLRLAALEGGKRWSFDCCLLFWSFLNELLLFIVDFKSEKQDNDNIKHTLLFQKAHFSRDTVFDREVDELMDTVRRFAQAGQLDFCILHPDDFIGKSAEWRLLLNTDDKVSAKTGLTRSVQWDIVHEICRLLINSRQLGIIANMQSFFKQMKNSSVPLSHHHLKQTFTENEQMSNELENAHYSASVLLQLWMADELDIDQENCIVDFPAHLEMAHRVHRLSRNVDCSNVSRHAALICLSTSLPIWARFAFKNTLPLVQTDKTPQILCTLFSALLAILQDVPVREEAERLVKSLAEAFLTTEEREKSLSTTQLAVAIFASLHRKTSPQLARYALLQLTVDLFLEDVEEEEEDEVFGEGGDQWSGEYPYEKSKLNALSDFDLLLQLLFEKLKEITLETSSGEQENTSTLLQQLEDTLHSIPKSLSTPLLEKIQQIDSLARQQQSSSNRFQQFTDSLRQALNCFTF